MYELLWLFRMGLILWIAWKAVLLLDCMNPLMAIFFAVLFMVGGPMLLDLAVDAHGSQSAILDYYANTLGVRQMTPIGFALIGVYIWNLFEAATLTARLKPVNQGQQPGISSEP